MSGRHLLDAAPVWIRRWAESMRRDWQRRRLKDKRWDFLFDPAPEVEWVSLDCETTGLNVRQDEIIAIGATRIVGRRIMTSERLELLVKPEREVKADSVQVHRLRTQDVAAGLPLKEAMERLLHFIGSRPLVGYYLEFDVAMINRALKSCFGLTLPQPRIEVSAMYYDYKFRQLPLYRQHDNADIDLRFSTIMRELDMPTRDAHDALNDAVMAALAFIKLRELRGEGRDRSRV
ncbi:MAG: 3'-5' exonuclease [Lautropia sp.]|nr:3'-5' exonuclease [Lautropia sp.]